MNLFQFVAVEFRDLFAGKVRPRLLVSLGIAVLLLTPYLRVLVSLLFRFRGTEREILALHRFRACRAHL